jgi:hypothetical protein
VSNAVPSPVDMDYLVHYLDTSISPTKPAGSVLAQFQPGLLAIEELLQLAVLEGKMSEPTFAGT